MARPTFGYQVKRWVDPTQLGWYSGDHHIHAAGCAHYANPTEGVHAEDMIRHCLGEDLKVGCNLTWGPCFDYQMQFFTGKDDEVSQLSLPAALRHRSLRLRLAPHGPPVPAAAEGAELSRRRIERTTGRRSGLNTLRWAKKQGAITGPAHSGSGLARSQERVDGPDGPGGLPNYAIPQYNGIGANEYIVDITHDVPGPDGKPVPAIDFISTMDTNRQQELNMWYHTLNCGFRVRASGETDFPCISGQRVGMGRVYVKIERQARSTRTGAKAFAQGRSYVSDGTSHLMEFVAATTGRRTRTVVPVGTNGSELKLDKPATIRLTAKVAARLDGKTVPIEAIVNAYPVAKKEIVADGSHARNLVRRADRAQQLGRPAAVSQRPHQPGLRPRRRQADPRLAPQRRVVPPRRRSMLEGKAAVLRRRRTGRSGESLRPRPRRLSPDRRAKATWNNAVQMKPRSPRRRLLAVARGRRCERLEQPHTSHGAPHPRMMPNGCLGSPVIVSLRS